MKSIPALCLLITVLMSVKAQSAAGGGGSHEEGDGLPRNKSYVNTDERYSHESNNLAGSKRPREGSEELDNGTHKITKKTEDQKDVNTTSSKLRDKKGEGVEYILEEPGLWDPYGLWLWDDESSEGVEYILEEPGLWDPYGLWLWDDESSEGDGEGEGEHRVRENLPMDVLGVIGSFDKRSSEADPFKRYDITRDNLSMPVLEELYKKYNIDELIEKGLFNIIDFTGRGESWLPEDEDLKINKPLMIINPSARVISRWGYMKHVSALKSTKDYPDEQVAGLVDILSLAFRPNLEMDTKTSRKYSSMLKILALEAGPVMDQILRGVESFNKIKVLSLWGMATPERTASFCESIGKLKELRILDLYNIKIGAAGAAAIVGSETLRNLTSLNLDGNFIGDAGAAAIAESTTLRNLTSLYLRGNRIDAAGAAAIAGSETLRNLTSLYLSQNRIGDEGAAAIAGSTTLRNLTSLILVCNGLGPAGAAAIAGSTTLRNLTSLNLSKNGIGGAGVAAIARSETLRNLTSLNLYRNYIGDAGAVAIARAVTLSKLTSLNFRYNGLGDEGAAAIAGSTTLRNLTSLNLSENGIGDEGGETIAGSETLRNLTSLNLDRNFINRAAIKLILDRFPFARY